MASSGRWSDVAVGRPHAASHEGWGCGMRPPRTWPRHVLCVLVNDLWGGGCLRSGRAREAEAPRREEGFLGRPRGICTEGVVTKQEKCGLVLLRDGEEALCMLRVAQRRHFDGARSDVQIDGTRSTRARRPRSGTWDECERRGEETKRAGRGWSERAARGSARTRGKGLRCGWLEDERGEEGCEHTGAIL